MQIHKTHSLQVQKPLLKLVVGLKSKVDELLEAQHTSLRVENFTGSIFLWVLSPEALPDAYREEQKKILSCFQCILVWRVEPRHFEIHSEHSVLLKDLPSRGNIPQVSQDLPGRRESPNSIPLQSSCLPQGEKKSEDRRHRLTKRLKSNHHINRTLICQGSTT